VLARNLKLALSALTAANQPATFMTNPTVQNDIQIDSSCSAAICEEIGDRLRITLTGEPNRLPQHMMMLIEQMAADRLAKLPLKQSTEVAQ
jgi:hypothetical protein